MFLLSVNYVTNISYERSSIACIEYVTVPQIINESEIFDIIITIKNTGNVSDYFDVKLKRYLIGSNKKTVYIPSGNTINVTFQLKLLYDGNLDIK